MATKVIKPAVIAKICDMCGDEKEHFIDGNGDRLTVNRGWIHSQSDRWPKQITANINVSIPYHPCDDICTDCLQEAFNQMIRDIENGKESEYGY